MTQPDQLKIAMKALQTARERTVVFLDPVPPALPRYDPKFSLESYTARVAQLREDYRASGVQIPPVTPVCEICNGSGAVKLNPDAVIDSPDFGKAKPCPGQLHHQTRANYLGHLGNLSAADVAIDLYDLREHHTETETIQYEGMRSPRPMSNIDMLNHFKAIAKNPLDHPLTYVLGPNGNGKTTAAIGLVNAINKGPNGPAIYTSLVELLAYIKEAYGNTGDPKDTSESRYQKLTTARTLVVDEFETGSGKVRLTEDNLIWISRWFADRYRQAMSRLSTTVIISNDHPKNLELPAIISRMKDFKRIICTAPDFRGNQDWLF